MASESLAPQDTKDRIKREIDHATQKFIELESSLPSLRIQLAEFKSRIGTFERQGPRSRQVRELEQKIVNLECLVDDVTSGRFKAKFDEMCQSLSVAALSLPMEDDSLDIIKDVKEEDSEDDEDDKVLSSHVLVPVADAREYAKRMLADTTKNRNLSSGGSYFNRSTSCFPHLDESFRRKALLNRAHSTVKQDRDSRLIRECERLFRPDCHISFLPEPTRAEKDICLDCNEPFIYSEDDARQWCPKCERSQKYFESTFNPFHSTNNANPTASGVSAPANSASSNVDFGAQLATLDTELNAYRERPRLYISSSHLENIHRAILSNRSVGTRGSMPSIGQQIAPATIKEIEVCIKQRPEFKQFHGNEFQIAEFLNNDKQPTLNEKQIERVKQLAKQFYPAFRSRFQGKPSMHYRFLIDKLCGVAGFTQFGKLDPQVKFSKPAGWLEKQWEEVCKILDWPC